MSDNACHQQFTWELSGKFPKGPEFGKATGIVEFDRVWLDVITVAGGDEVTPHELKYPDDKSDPFNGCKLMVVTAPPKENGEADIYKYLQYRWEGTDQKWKDFGLSPLVLLGSVTKLIPKVENISFRYKPPQQDCTPSNKNPKPPAKATLDVVIAMVRGGIL